MEVPDANLEMHIWIVTGISARRDSVATDAQGLRAVPVLAFSSLHDELHHTVFACKDCVVELIVERAESKNWYSAQALGVRCDGISPRGNASYNPNVHFQICIWYFHLRSPSVRACCSSLRIAVR